MKKFILKIIMYGVFVILFTGITIRLSIYLKPEVFRGSYAEYLMWEYQKSIMNKKEGNKNIILGDSRALAGIDPKILGNNFINLGLGGSTPIEGFYTLKRILKTKQIDTLIIAYGEYHYMESDQFKSRTLAFNFIDEKELHSIESLESKFDRSIDVIELNLMSKIERRTILNSFPFPYYQSTYISNLKSFFTTKNTPHEEMKQNNGHVLFGRADSADGYEVENNVANFKEHEVIDSYVDSIISLAIKNNAFVVFTNLPFNESTFKNLENNGFNKSFQNYLISKKNKFNNNQFRLILNRDNFGNIYFGDDAGHLNRSGCERYTNYLRKAL